VHMDVLKFPDRALLNASKKELIQMVLSLRCELDRLQKESELKIGVLQKELEEKENQLTKQTQESINKKILSPRRLELLQQLHSMGKTSIRALATASRIGHHR
jgi:predicted transcriptional regulator